MIEQGIHKIVMRENLSRDEMHEIFGEMMDGRATDVQKSAFLVALRMKGETSEEVAGAVAAMRDRLTPLDVDPEGLVDTCGTGGDGRGTFNVSTVAAFVVAGAGGRVAKHGNRGVSSKCGSADVLAALGVDVSLDAPQAAEVLRRVGISFLFAQKLHPAMGALASVRRELGMRTIINLLGPLTNPARTRRQLLGVYSPPVQKLVAEALVTLGAEHTMVVHSHDGLDEISISAPTHVFEVRDGTIREFDVTPEEFGLVRSPFEEVLGGDVEHNATIAREVLGGRTGAVRDIVLANAGAALFVAGVAADLVDGIARARQSLDTGRAREKLNELVSVTNEIGGAV